MPVAQRRLHEGHYRLRGYSPFTLDLSAAIMYVAVPSRISYNPSVESGDCINVINSQGSLCATVYINICMNRMLMNVYDYTLLNVQCTHYESLK